MGVGWYLYLLSVNLTPIDTHWWLSLQFCISTPEDGHEPCPKHVEIINQVKQAASRWLFTYTIF